MLTPIPGGRSARSKEVRSRVRGFTSFRFAKDGFSPRESGVSSGLTGLRQLKPEIGSFEGRRLSIFNDLRGGTRRGM